MRSEGQSKLDIGALFSKLLPGTIRIDDVLTGVKELGQREFYIAAMQKCLVASPTITQTGGLILQLCDAESGGFVINDTPAKAAVVYSTYSNGHDTVISKPAVSSVCK